MRFDLQSAIAVLERTPRLLDAMLRGLPDHWIRQNEGGETWSPFDVVGHLIDGEETDWMERARLILSDAPSRRFVPFDRFRHLGRNRGRLDDPLDEFARSRRQNLSDLGA
jgi:hypothetical protein